MSPLFIVAAIVAAAVWGYIVFRAARKNPSGFVMQAPWLPSNAQPQTFKPEIEDAEGHTELLEEHPKSRHHKGGNQHPF